jgi:hypothetical protein
MECTQCHCKWCYACGKDDVECPRGKGCDAISVYLHRQPGWGAFNVGSESDKVGALFEFHRRKIAFAIRRVKERLEKDVRDAFWCDFFYVVRKLLTSVPPRSFADSDREHLVPTTTATPQAAHRRAPEPHHQLGRD